RRWRHEAVAPRFVAGRDAVDVEAYDFGLLRLRSERCDDRMQRPHPGEPALAPPHRLRPGKAAHHLRYDLADHLDRGPPLLLNHSNVEPALLAVACDLRLADRRQSRGLEESRDRAFGRADARSTLLLLEIGLARRHAGDREREPAGRRE